MTDPTFWSPEIGRELDASPIRDEVRPSRVVACLNVWNDKLALMKTMPTWMAYVDHVIAVDGAYTTDSLSNDGTREFLRDILGDRLTLIDYAGVDQCTKRTAYFRAAESGDRCFVIDADESVVNPHALRSLPFMDIGWVRVASSLYKRTYGQPRIFRRMHDLQYRGRHHWIYANDVLVSTHQYSGHGFHNRVIPLTLINQRQLGRSRTRMSAKRESHVIQLADERAQCAMPSSRQSDEQIGGREALQILHHTYRDDGLAPSRLHTAINRTTPHGSLFFKGRPGPFGVPEQYSIKLHAAKLQHAMHTCDIVHYHGVMPMVQTRRPNVHTVFHHHGTLFRNNCVEYMRQAKQRNALVLLSNLELFSWTDGGQAYFLPNTVPVARYMALRQKYQRPFDGTLPFRLAHSPSQPKRKGTDQLVAVVTALQARGIPIELVMIHDVTHAESLKLKASCHGAFDSFWLGMQCSGIESAAMGLMTIAGDTTVRDRSITEYGYCPYTFAENADELEMVVERMVSDDDYRTAHAAATHHHIVHYHDEAAVSLRYLDLLDQQFHWRSNVIPSKNRTLLQARGAT